MLDKKTAAQIGDVMAAIQGNVDDTILWNSLPELAALSEANHDITFDLAASRVIGVPVVIAVPRRSDRLKVLTPRQRQVAACIADGLSNKEIALRLSISLSTVKDHVHAILTRLKLGRRTQIVALMRPDSI